MVQRSGAAFRGEQKTLAGRNLHTALLIIFTPLSIYFVFNIQQIVSILCAGHYWLSEYYYVTCPAGDGLDWAVIIITYLQL